MIDQKPTQNKWFDFRVTIGTFITVFSVFVSFGATLISEGWRAADMLAAMNAHTASIEARNAQLELIESNHYAEVKRSLEMAEKLRVELQTAEHDDIAQVRKDIDAIRELLERGLNVRHGNLLEPLPEQGSQHG
jgi:hypothetical protein